MLHKTNIFCLLAAFVYIFGSAEAKVQAQTASDSLLLEQIISEIIKSHPSVKQAEELLNIADAKIGLSHSAYLPNIDASGSMTLIGPVPSISFLGREIEMAPALNYNAGINYNQTIYDFGKTSKNIEYENENKNLSQQTIEQVKQTMAIIATNTFYTLVFLQNALEIKEEQLKTLNEHLEIATKRKETGSGIEYDVLSTKVKISGIESQKIDLETAIKSVGSVINSLLGLSDKNIIRVKKELNIKLSSIEPDSMVSYALNNRAEIKIAQEKSKLANLMYNITKLQNNPILIGYATGGFKNGYMADLYALKPNFTAGIGFKLPIFDGNRKKHSLTLVKSAVQNCDYEIEQAKRNITNDVIQNQSNVKASEKK